MIKKIEMEGEYSVTVTNDQVKEETILSVADWQLAFCKRENVEAHIALLQRALEFWEYDNLPGKGNE